MERQSHDKPLQRSRYLNRGRNVGTKIWPGTRRIKLQAEQIDLFGIFIQELRTQAEAQTKQEGQQQKARVN
jgi:hypothetical protein